MTSDERFGEKLLIIVQRQQTASNFYCNFISSLKVKYHVVSTQPLIQIRRPPGRAFLWIIIYNDRKRIFWKCTHSQESMKRAVCPRHTAQSIISTMNPFYQIFMSYIRFSCVFVVRFFKQNKQVNVILRR